MNNGKSPLNPLRTIAAVLPRLYPNIRVGLARGSHWREEFYIAASIPGINLAAYGIGARPLLDASNIAPNASFIKSGGFVNIYQIGVTPEWYGLGQDGFNAWENNVVMPRAANLAALDAAPGQCYISGVAGAITFYVHAGDSSDVIVNGKTYEYTHRKTGVFTRACSSAIYRGLHTRRNLYSGGSVVAGTNVSVYDCRCSDGNAHSLLIESGLIDGCLVDEAYLNTGSNSMIIINKDTCAGETVIIRDTTISNTITSGVAIQAIYGHHNVAGNFGAVLIDNCIFIGNIKLSISFGYMASLTIQNCTAITITASGPTFCRMNFAAPYTLSGNIARTMDGQIVSIEVDGIPVNLSNNTVYVGNTGTAGIYSSNIGFTITFTNNNFLPDVGVVGNRIAVWFTQAANTIIASGNLFRIGGFHYAWFCPNGIANFTSDFNNFILDNRNRWTGGVTYTGLAAWQAAVAPQEANSTES
jgi:hypothetical protein